MEKHVVTPPAEGVVQPIKGVLLFKAPAPAHLIVAELPSLPSGPRFRQAKRAFIWEPQDAEQVYANHAHREQELFVCVKGPVHFTLSRGGAEVEVTLERGDAIFISRWIWHAIRIKEKGAMLMVLCETVYNRRGSYMEDDYLYDLFMHCPASVRLLMDTWWRVRDRAKRALKPVTQQGRRFTRLFSSLQRP